MTHSQRFSVISITASAFVVWLFVVTQIQPNKEDFLLMATFFVSFITWMGSILSFLLYRYRIIQSNREVIYAFREPSIRQGFVIATTLAILLFLQLIRVAGIWEIFLVIMVAYGIEMALRYNPLVSKARGL